MSENFFTGRFHAVTHYSVWEVWVHDLNASPVVRKVRYQGDKVPVVVPVTGYLLGGFYLAITADGLIKYNVKRHQRTHVTPQTLRPLVEELPRRRRRGKTHMLKGLFFDRDEAEECLTTAVPEPFSTFYERWHKPTRDVLNRIGHFHPLISLSIGKDFGLPPVILPHNDEFGRSETGE